MSTETDPLTNVSWFPASVRARPWAKHPLLWSLAVVALIGDATTTWYGIQNGLQEANPLAEAVLHTGGFPAMWAVKGLALMFTAVAQSMLSERYTAVAPAIPAFLWGFAAVSNSLLIFLV